MRRAKRWARRAMMAVALAVPVGSAAGQEAPAPPQADTRQAVGFSVSSRDAALTFHLADGSSLRIAFQAGDVLVNGDRMAGYATDGPLAAAWEALLLRAGELSTDQMVLAAQGLGVEDPSETDAAALQSLNQTLAPLRPVGTDVPPPPVAPLAPGAPDLEAARAAADRARTDLDAMRDEMRDAIRQSIRGVVRDVPRQTIRQTIRNGGNSRLIGPASVPDALLALVGTFLALGGIAFGLSFFAERQLDIVADTASAALARSFFVGLFAQPLVIPAFGMLIVGLTLTVLGILVIPFAVLGFFAVLVAFLVGGYLAVARAAGEAWARQRGRHLEAGGFGTLKKTLAGLGIVLSVWVPAVLLGWVPVVGAIITWTAILATWAAATTGFGAAILTRGGLRGTFGRKFRPRPLAELSWPEPEPAERFDTAEWLGRKER